MFVKFATKHFQRICVQYDDLEAVRGVFIIKYPVKVNDAMWPACQLRSRQCMGLIMITADVNISLEKMKMDFFH